MRLDVLQALLSDIVTRHKADITFFTGLRSDFDPASARKFPAVHVQPITKNRIIFNGQYTINWTVLMEVVDRLPEDRQTTDINAMLNRMDVITDEILFELHCFGDENKSLTVNNIAHKFDFQIPAPIDGTVIIDETENNLTGWATSFTIVEPVDGSDIVCCLTDSFRP